MSVQSTHSPAAGSRPRGRIRRAALRAAVVAAASLCLVVQATAASDEAKRGGTLIVGHTTVRHLNPAVQSGNATGVPGAQIFASLVQLDEGFNIVPYLAKSWSVSEDGLSYTFELEENAVFHDGQPITSEDVAFSLDVVKNNHPFGLAMFAAVDRVETPSPHVAVFRLSEPHPALLPALSPVLMPILPKHVYGDGQDLPTHPANLKPVGSGPFKFVEWQEGEHITVERFDQFFRPGRPYLDRIVFRIIEDPLTRRIALESGEVQYAPFAGVRATDVPALQQAPGIVVSTKGYGALGPINYLEFNLRKPPFDDLRVRKAFAHTIDTTFITKALHRGISTPLSGPFHHTSPWYSESAVQTYPVDLEKAAALLDEAGLKAGADGMRASFEMDVPPFNPDSMRTVADYLKAQFKKVGIDLRLRVAPDFPSWASRVSNWEHEVTMNAIWNYPDPVIGVHRAYLCTNQKKGVIWSNTEGYCNAKVDEILNKAAVAIDAAERKALYEEFQRIVTDELPFVWTNEEPYVTVYRDQVRNPPETVWGALSPMDEVYLAQ